MRARRNQRDHAGRSAGGGDGLATIDADLDGALGETADLITSSAFFDLTSVGFMRRFAAAAAATTTSSGCG